MTPGPLSAPLLDPSGGRNRVAIVSGSFGAGHDAAARELADRLRRLGCRVDRYDVVDLLPARMGRLLKSAYYGQLRTVPATWGTTLTLTEPGRPLHRAALAVLGRGGAPVTRAVAGADLVIATHPFAGLALGRARSRGILAAPVVTYLTDASVHAMWVHPGVDLHLAIHDIAAGQARRWGGRTVTVAPLVPARDPRRTPCRDPLSGLGLIGPRALVTGGSLGIGELERAARDVAASGVMMPVVACGENGALARHLDRAGITALGWRDDLRDVIDSCHCVVQNAGGFTSLEALASGTPVLTYLPIPGHGVTNAESLEEAGLAAWPRTSDELRTALARALHGARRPLVTDAPSVVDVLTASSWEALAGPAPVPVVAPRPMRHESVA